MTEFTDSLPRRRLKLNRQERRTAVLALARMQAIPGVDVAGDRARYMQDRFERGDTSVNLPEFNTLGFALSRLDSPHGDKLLKRLTGAANGKPATTMHEMLARAVATTWARLSGRADKSDDCRSA